MKPVVAIIGRPNVGKSTLFNRLSWRKKAIVIDEPGATRDRNYAEATWRNRAFVLIDTGGFEPASTEQILVQMREQTRLAMEEADVLLFVMDGRDGLLPADREIAGLLRGIGKPVFFLVNKVDGPRHEGFLSEFYRLGVEPLYPVSAQHGLGIAEVMEEVVAHLPETEAPPEEDARIRIAVMGKPNVGKSSLVNRILGYERSIVNPLPGTTRDPIDTPFSLNGQAYLLVDTAGIRRKSRVSLTLEKYSVVQAIKAVERCDIAVLLLDALEGVTEQDAKIAGLACEQGKAVIVAVNKWDAVEKNNATAGSYVRNIRETFKFMPYAPIVFLSALTGQRVAKIFTIVDAVWKQYTRRVSTAELNRRVAAFLLANPPPHHDPGAAPFQYVTQVAVKPPTFVLFVREPKAIHFSYERYLVNQIREAFGFDLVPIQLFFRRKTRSAKDA